MTDSVYNKLAFNGFHVTYWNHETRTIEDQHFPKSEDVIKRGFTRDGDPFPDAKTFADDLFDVYGDCVGMVKDNNGVVLLDNMQEMDDMYREMNRY